MAQVLPWSPGVISFDHRRVENLIDAKTTIATMGLPVRATRQQDGFKTGFDTDKRGEQVWPTDGCPSSAEHSRSTHRKVDFEFKDTSAQSVHTKSL
jgi:hypothetical protein